MEIPIWLAWVFALLLASMPAACTMIIARKVDKVRPKKRCAKPLEFNPAVAGLGFLDYDDQELYVIVHMMATVQAQEYWEKDIARIV